MELLKTKRIDTAEVNFTRPTALLDDLEEILSPAARQFLTSLHLRFGPERRRLLARRAEAAARYRAGELPSSPPETEWIRTATWRVDPVPRALRRRHVEITGPAEPKMMINALNSGADGFMADLEDSLSPTWEKVIRGHRCLKRAAYRELRHEGEDGRTYELRPSVATLHVRPRGWHLEEQNFLVNGEAMSASLFDFGLFVLHCAKPLLRAGAGPYLYLPKLESHLEARLWNEVFVFAEHSLGLAVGTIRATVLIETFPAAFQMDEILYELREHAAGLNAGRWDYLFSLLKTLPVPELPYPDRARLTMDLPFLRSYAERLVRTCHRRSAHAIGGMAAFIPSRRDPAVNSAALTKVRADKARELHLGFDGTWVAHPDLVAPVKHLFEFALGGADEQKHVLPTGTLDEAALFPRELPHGVTEAGVRTNLFVALKYLHHWLSGQGAVAIHHLMEDAATAEISRLQLWQWTKAGVTMDTGARLDRPRFEALLDEELARLAAAEALWPARRSALRALVAELSLGGSFPEFLTVPAYELLLREELNHATLAREAM